MPQKSELSAQHCLPCKGEMAPLQGEELSHFAQQLPSGWEVVDGHHLTKEFRFKNFKDALAFTNRVGAIAEQEQHHPDLALAYGRVSIRLWTHKIQGLSRNDFILAAKCEDAFHYKHYEFDDTP